MTSPATLPELDPDRKPPRRFWLFAPYVAALIIIAVWSVVWICACQAVERGMGATAARLRGEGFTAQWASRRVYGYPFRIDVDLQGLSLAEPSGWALYAPSLKTEAYAYRLEHWIGFAPNGVVLARPGAGSVTITGQALRASFTRTGAAPNVAVEGLKLEFTPQAGAKPFPIASADHLGLYLRPLPGGLAEAQLQIRGATAPPAALLARLGQGRPSDVVLDAQLTQAGALHGPNWPAAVKAWDAAGGTLTAVHAALSAPPIALQAEGAGFTVGADGRLQGQLSLDASADRGAVGAISGAGGAQATVLDLAEAVLATRARAAKAKVDLVFQAGVTTLGPVAIAPAPKVY